MEALLGGDRERLDAIGRPGDGAANADPWVVVEEKAAIRRRVVEQLPRKRQDRRVLGGDCQHAIAVPRILETMEQPKRDALPEDRLEQAPPPLRQQSGDAPGLLIVRIAERMRAVG